jgi:hypothetical protein
VKNPSFQFVLLALVLLLDFAGDFEDDDENEEDRASGCFSSRR